MQTIKLITRVDADGNIALKMPDSFANQLVEVVVKSEGTEALQHQESWPDFVNRMDGILADDPIERGDQGTFEIREEIE